MAEPEYPPQHTGMCYSVQGQECGCGAQQEYKVRYKPFAFNTATAIPHFEMEGQTYLLVNRRKNLPYMGKLALPGGFQEEGGETLPEAAAREVKEEQGYICSPKDMKLVCVQSEPTRDPRGVVVDHVYSFQLTPIQLFYAKAGDDAASIELYIIGPNQTRQQICNDFAFDHGDSICQFLGLSKS